MKLELRHILWPAAAALLLLSLWRPWQQKDDDLKHLLFTDFARLTADLNFEEIRYTRNSVDGVRWTLDAASARLYEDSGRLTMEAVAIRFFPRGGGDVRVTADAGTYFMDMKQISLEGGVVVNSEAGRELRTETLHYSEEQNRIWTEDDVLILAQGLALRGEGLEYDPDTGRLTVRNQTAILSDTGEFEL